ncbi:polyisoprenoid-binding protein YceI [Caulobacter ginsengisoli]|uniref:Polyisoprenoid-binding protein YceI n=1 Tax=Caulobacter ginsengisoli TaxID=400775 RepID=A0ABU0IZF9_9CAUL|nr:YceI family protein [Caulobacter ginsengisoli]MDQ0466681.1 polyisoprenoid-binding protein YceI [Caulobacter ginsengisoli]
MKVLAATLVLLAASPALAAGPAPAWSVDKPASKIAFASSFGGTAFSGSFRTWDAQVRFDPNNLPGSSVVVTIDTAAVSTGDPDRDKTLPDTPWFASAKYPKAVFRTQSFRALGGGRYQAIGTLTLRGVTKPLTLPFTLAITGPNAKMTAQMGLNRLAFGVGQGEWAKTNVIPSTVNLTISLTAHRAK